MFSNLSKGSVLYGLDMKGDAKVFTAQVDTISFPRPKNIQTTFGQIPEMVVDIVCVINGERREFRQIPSNNAVADFGENAFILADSKDSLANYIRSLRQTSKNVIDSYSKHEKLIPQYDNALQELNPELVNESAVNGLREEVNSLKSQLAEAISLLKAGTNKQD